MQEHNIVIPGISLCQKWGKIRIFHSTIVALGEPKYIRFLFNPEKRGLVVQACARKEAECFRVPKYNPENWEFSIWLSQMSNGVGAFGQDTPEILEWIHKMEGVKLSDRYKYRFGR